MPFISKSLPGGGGTAIPKRRGVPPEPHGAHGETKKFRVTKRELLINLSNIYKCKASPGRTFSLGNFVFDERENCQV